MWFDSLQLGVYNNDRRESSWCGKTWPGLSIEALQIGRDPIWTSTFLRAFWSKWKTGIGGDSSACCLNQQIKVHDHCIWSVSEISCFLLCFSLPKNLSSVGLRIQEIKLVRLMEIFDGEIWKVQLPKPLWLPNRNIDILVALHVASNDVACTPPGAIAIKPEPKLLNFTHCWVSTMSRLHYVVTFVIF